MTSSDGNEQSKSLDAGNISQLRTTLLDLEHTLADRDFPVLILLAGIDGAGKGEIANKLHEWMDPRGIVTRAFDDPSDEELERPEFWRFWRALPANGMIGLFLNAWYRRPVLDYVYGRSTAEDFERELERVIAFERTLADDGALLVKFWMHLEQDAQKRRFEQLAADPDQAWRVTKTDWEHWRLHDRFAAAGRIITDLTDQPGARWTVIDSEDTRVRAFRVGSHLAASIRHRLEAPPVHATSPAPAASDRRARRGLLERLESSRDRLDSDTYNRQLASAQARLNACYRQARRQGISTVLVFEGWDAAGKGGAIRRLTNALDARGYEVVATRAPTDEERAHHYLWRFWRHLPRAGRFVIFDRSWYGRVLVERVEELARRDEWQRAYSEIEAFENELVERGIVLVKFWLHITQDEQAARFEERKRVAHKRWKLTPEDWRNREHWDDYVLAVEDMVERTSTPRAPWTLIDANDKRRARIEIIEAVCSRLESGLAASSAPSSSTIG